MEAVPQADVFPFGDRRQVGCAPMAETCNDRDDDCEGTRDGGRDLDGRADEGVCCGDPFLPARFDYAGRPAELLIADVGSGTGVRFAVRGDDGVWSGFAVDNGSPPSTPRRLTGLQDVAAGPGIALVTAGRATLLLTRGVADVEARWAQPDSQNDARLKPPRILPCTDVLEVARLGPNDETDRVVVVCPDRILRLSPWREYEDLEDRRLMPEVGAAWATSAGTDLPLTSRLVLLGFRGRFVDDYVLRLLRVPVAGPITEEVLPAEVAQIPAADYASPLWLRPPTAAVPGGWGVTWQAPAGRNPRAWLPGVSGANAWREVVPGRAPDRVEFAPGTGRAFASRRDGDALDFWVVSTNFSESGDQGATYVRDRLGLWTRERAFRVPDAAGALWGVHRGSYNYEAVIVVPDPAGGGFLLHQPYIVCPPLRY
jgi:hypothetical protein